MSALLAFADKHPLWTLSYLLVVAEVPARVAALMLSRRGSDPPK